MKVLPILVLLSSVAQLCSATPVEPLTCSEDNAATAAHFAMHHINMHHHHGYKFRLSEIQGNKTEKVDDGCNIELQLDLLETKCHTVNPKPFEDCELWSESDRAVIANCTVMISVKNSDAKVTKYNCDTRQVLTNSEMASICPDCPVLVALNNTNGLRAVDSIVKTFNKNTSNQHYYILHEVGRILTGYIPGLGMKYRPEAVLVETRCPMGSRIAIEACKPLCPDRAHHALCSASSNSMGVLGDMDCEFYPPKNTTALGPDEKEPVCKPHPHHGGHFDPPGPPGHAHRKGPPPHAHGQSDNGGKGGKHKHDHDHDHLLRGHPDPPGLPGHANRRGPPPHAHGHGHSHDHGQGHGHGSPPRPHGPHGPHGPPCHGVLTNVDPALHPICPWPHPEPPANPRES
ncbi:Alpha-2-HS-glycoprotein [Larimichthys crocea]|uniref:Uncharacterized protein n=1 Tax=Larimichthys crocea TaxID=215358 RepID=A0ACD3RKG4_LARCR|nr:Alpha-2-HS-glycoprotein [Larimichthys crocea]